MCRRPRAASAGGRGGALTWRRRLQVLELLKAGARTDVADLSGFSALDVAEHIETHSYSWRNSANRSQLRRGAPGRGRGARPRPLTRGGRCAQPPTRCTSHRDAPAGGVRGG